MLHIAHQHSSSGAQLINVSCVKKIVTLTHTKQTPMTCSELSYLTLQHMLEQPNMTKSISLAR